VTRERDQGAPSALHDLARRLPRDIEPPAELWQRIAARLEEPALPRSLEERARDLPADIAPPVDLWPQIAARLRTGPREPRLLARLVAAAAAVAAVAVLVTVATRDPDSGANSGSSTPTVATSDDATAEAAPSTVLGAAWMLRSPVVSDEVAAALQRDLMLVRDERLQIEAAIDREPGDAGLRELWAYTYQIELQLTDTYGRIIMAYERG
jgi:hypothetical protein